MGLSQLVEAIDARGRPLTKDDVFSALASARSGARTALIEQHGCLGGIWTAGALSWILDHENKTGIMQEILAKMTALAGRAVRDGKPTNGCDVEKMKLLR